MPVKCIVGDVRQAAFEPLDIDWAFRHREVVVQDLPEGNDTLFNHERSV
jgi:hypothetical protein